MTLVVEETRKHIIAYTTLEHPEKFNMIYTLVWYI